MAITIEMPRLSDSMHEGTVLRLSLIHISEPTRRS